MKKKLAIIGLGLILVLTISGLVINTYRMKNIEERQLKVLIHWRSESVEIRGKLDYILELLEQQKRRQRMGFPERRESDA